MEYNKKTMTFNTEEWLERFIGMTLQQNEIGINPKELNIRNIKYKKNVENDYEYHIIRSTTCDGTMMFLDELILDTIGEMCVSASYYKNKPPVNIEEVERINYEIGNIKVTEEHEDFGTEEKPWLHTRWIISIPVRTEYVYK